MGIDQSTKRLVLLKHFMRLNEQVSIEGKEYPVKLRSAIQQCGIRSCSSAVYLGSKHINCPLTEPQRDRARDVRIHGDGKGALQQALGLEAYRERRAFPGHPGPKFFNTPELAGDFLIE